MLSFSIDTQITKELIALNELISEKYAFLGTLPKDERAYTVMRGSEQLEPLPGLKMPY